MMRLMLFLDPLYRCITIGECILNFSGTRFTKLQGLEP